MGTYEETRGKGRENEEIAQEKRGKVGKWKKMRGTGRKKGMIKLRKLPRYAATYRAMERTARGFDIIINVAALSSSSSKLTY